MDRGAWRAAVHGVAQSRTRLSRLRTFPVAQWVKNMPATQETQEMCGRSLGQEDSLEKCMTTHSSLLAWRILWTEEPAGLRSTGSQ